MSLWKIPTAQDVAAAAENPLAILQEYARQLRQDSDGRFVGTVTTTLRDDTAEAFYALYVTTPKLQNYTHRLAEVRVRDVFDPYGRPVTLRFFAKDPINNSEEACDSPADLRQKLTARIASPLTQGILSQLLQLAAIIEDHQ